mgnify:CR=1 FL=1
MAKATHVMRSRKDIPEGVCGIKGGIPKGTSYYWWKFKRFGKRFSLTPPKRSQLTRSSFYSAIYDLEDAVISKAGANDLLQSIRDDVVSSLEDVRDECQNSLDNMPDGLQQGPTGELLQERIDAMDSAISEFEDLELEEPDDEALEEHGLPEREDGESDESFTKRTADDRDGAVMSYWQSKLDEFQSISIETP